MSPRDAAAPGWTTEGGAENRADGLGIRIGRETDPPPERVADAALELATMSPRDRATWLCGYEFGWMHSRDAYELSYEQQMTDLAAHYVRMIHLNEEIERDLASTVRSQPFADLADRRGQHDRAERQRWILRERGIA